MSMGLPFDDQILDSVARLHRLLDEIAPGPLPADLAIAELRQMVDTAPAIDAETLGRLAYHCLTGADPGEAGGPPPESAVDVVAGFPPFASEVLMRACDGDPARRPSASSLLVVLETIPADAWPQHASVVPVIEPEADTEALQETAEEPPAPKHSAPGRRKGKARRTPQLRPSSVTVHGPQTERTPTLVFAGVLLILVVVGIVYAANRDSPDGDASSPQGASLVIAQPDGVLA